jgi:hypothetical protein
MPTTTAAKIKHIKAIQDLSSILAGARDSSNAYEYALMRTSTHPTTTQSLPAQRVAAPSPRLANAPPPRVATTSNNITAPNVIRHMPLVHQCLTRNNNPFHILSDDDDDEDTVVASNCSPRDPPPNLPTSDLRTSQLRKRQTRQLLSPPMNRLTCQLASQPRSPPPTRQPSSPPASPPPRVLASPSTVHAMAQTAPHVPIHDLHPKPTEKPSKPTARTKPTTYSIPIVEPDDDRDEMPTTRPASPPRRSTRLISSRTPCSISCQALYHVIGLGFTNAPANTVPTSFAQHHKQYTGLS